MQNQGTILIPEEGLPPNLKRLHKPPKQLFVRGNDRLIYEGIRVSIVGTRRFTPYGREVTVSVASALAKAGAIIVSGLALGIDSIAHKACLDAGGRTIAVLPSGPENIFPRSHYQLAKQILDTGGLLLSENPNDYQPHKGSFLERNRLVAALSDLVIVPEAARVSGSLNTAGHALELGISVMAVPGNINSPASEGTNRLIKSGAEPLTNVEDALDALGLSNDTDSEYLPENQSERIILELIRSGQTSTSEIIRLSEMSASEAQTILTLLEIKGVLVVNGGNWSLL